MHYWRKKSRLKNLDIAKGTLNEIQGANRSYNTPIPVLLTPSLSGYIQGDGREILKLLSKIKSLGKKRSYGFGKVLKVEIKEIAEDFSWIKDNKTMRFLPDNSGTKFTRPRPPYWHRHERTNCLEIGELIS